MGLRVTTSLSVLLILLLMVSAWAFNPAPYDTVTIYELQYVADPATDDFSPRVGDTVVVKGQVMTYPRDLWVGARWAVYIVDPDSFPNPWSGFFVIQHDTFVTETAFQFVEPGWICYFTGVVAEYNGFSQIALLTNPPVPIEVVSTDNPFPNPVVLTAADLEGKAAAEKWESMWVRVENASVVNNNVPGNWASITDASGGLTYMGEYFNWFRDRLLAGTYMWPVAGTRLNVNGFVRDEPAGFSVNPRTDADLEILSNPPVITDVTRMPAAPTSQDAVTVTAVITDNGTVDQAQLWYSVNWGNFQSVNMTANVDTFSADIPAQADGAFVRYFVTAVDNEGDFSQMPGDTSQASGSIYFYVVRDQGVSIKDLQYHWGYALDASGYEGYEVTVRGVVTTDSTDFYNRYYIQEKDSAWYGIQVYDPANTVMKGDLIEVTGTVQEYFGVTRIGNVTSVTVVTAGVGEPTPVTVTTGEVATGGANAEAYESVLIQVQNVTVTDPFPDAPRNFGEFVVDDGSGGVRVDDYSMAFEGNIDSTFKQGDTIGKLIALGYYSFGNYKLIPRDTNDVIDHVTSIDDADQLVAETFSLSQNYPNPFNPSTRIQYSVARAGKYQVVVFNVLGQRVKTLFNGFLPVGRYTITWNGVDEAGNPVSSGIYFYSLIGKDVQLTRKMILLK